MSSRNDAHTKPTHYDTLPTDDAKRLNAALEESADVTVFVNGTTVRLPPKAMEAVMDVLGRLAQQEAVTISTSEKLLNTSEAAQLAGVSNTYIRNLTDAGTIPVEYRGSHRRIRSADVLAWLAERAAEEKDSS